MAAAGGALPVLYEYRRLLHGIDARFLSIRSKHGSRMRCGKGCIDCCRGLFDVPVPDALLAAAGFHGLRPSVKNDILLRAASLHASLLQESPGLEAPFFLDGISEDGIDRLADCFDTVRCPFLGNDDGCLIYRFRPLACILEGIPMVDARDGLFDDWCRLNFTGGVDRAVEGDLVLDYYEIEAAVRRAAENLTAKMPVFPRTGATVFLPSVVVAFEGFWRSLVSG